MKPVTHADYETVINWLNEDDRTSEAEASNTTGQQSVNEDQTNQNVDMNSIELYAQIKSVSAAEATKAINNLKTKIKAKDPKITDQRLDELIFMKVKMLQFDMKGDKADVVLLAMGPYEDSNFPRKQKCLNEAKKNLADAISNNYIMLGENDEQIPIDNREFFGNPPNPERPNPDFRKPIEPNLKRTCVVLTAEGIVLPGEGKFDGELGQIAHATGRITLPGVDKSGKPVDGRISIYQNGWKATGETLDPQDIWNQTFGALKTSDFAVPLDSIWDTEPYRIVATMGKVVSAKETKATERQPQGGAMLTITETGLAEDVTGFVVDEPQLKAIVIDSLEQGMEVIVFGDVNKYVGKDGKERKSMNILGVVPNPASSELAAAIKNIDDLNFD